jgi:hypothetical protein
MGGTSLASSVIAAITNNAGHFRKSTAAEDNALYQEFGTGQFLDITTGQCGNGAGGALVNETGAWDLCTGMGAPRGKTGL